MTTSFQMIAKIATAKKKKMLEITHPTSTHCVLVFFIARRGSAEVNYLNRSLSQRSLKNCLFSYDRNGRWTSLSAIVKIIWKPALRQIYRDNGKDKRQLSKQNNKTTFQIERKIASDSNQLAKHYKKVGQGPTLY